MLRLIIGPIIVLSAFLSLTGCKIKSESSQAQNENSHTNSATPQTHFTPQKLPLTDCITDLTTE